MSFTLSHKQQIAQAAVAHFDKKIKSLERELDKIGVIVAKKRLNNFWKKTKHLPKGWFQTCGYYSSMSYSNSKGYSIDIRIPKSLTDNKTIPQDLRDRVNYAQTPEDIRPLIDAYIKLTSDIDKMQGERRSLRQKILDEIKPYRTLDKLKDAWPNLVKFTGEIALNGQAIVKQTDFKQLEKELTQSKS